MNGSFFPAVGEIDRLPRGSGPLQKTATFRRLTADCLQPRGSPTRPARAAQGREKIAALPAPRSPRPEDDLKSLLLTPRCRYPALLVRHRGLA